MTQDKKLIAFALYAGVSPLDLVGPLTVLRNLGPGWPFQTIVVGERIEPLDADSPVHMIADATFEQVPHPFALVVPGGRMPTVRAMSDPVMRAYVRTAADSAEILVLVRNARPVRRALRARALGRGRQVHHVGGGISRHRLAEPAPAAASAAWGDWPRGAAGCRQAKTADALRVEACIGETGGYYWRRSGKGGAVESQKRLASGCAAFARGQHLVREN
jgi:hypothetical protein